MNNRLLKNKPNFQSALERAKRTEPRLELRLRLISVLYSAFRDPEEEANHYADVITEYCSLYESLLRQSKEAYKKGGEAYIALSQRLLVRAEEQNLLNQLLYDLTHD